VRGATLSRSSLLFEGAFGRIFRALPAADFGDDDQQSEAALHELAVQMVAEFEPPKDGPDDEESGIPSAVTYLGQFIDHDLTFDPASSLQRQNDPDALVDFRTPRFDLDNLYGRGPDDQPYLYTDNGRQFILGERLTGAKSNPNARDLPRSNPQTGPKRAIIGDPRNDENVIISQLQGLFQRFHNRVATDNPTWSFEAIQRAVRFHYQFVVFNDFLPTVIDKSVLNEILPHRAKGTNVLIDPPALRFFKPKKESFMPLEFSAAAYRFGHSMVRPGYRVNEEKDNLRAIFPVGNFKGLTGFDKFARDLGLDWGRFINLAPKKFGDENDPKNPGNKDRLQLAYRIDTSLVNPLGVLPESVASRFHSLAERNLLRGWRMRLPNGQSVARAMGLAPTKEILIGKFTGDQGDIRGAITDFAGTAFVDNCPLWTYVLAETIESDVTVKTLDGDKVIKTRKLGPVGGRIVAETIVGLLLNDSSSFLAQDPRFTPTSYKENGVFGLRELIKAALEFGGP
jgi:hypothetical protein